MASRTMFEKIWESHVVRTEEDGTALLYVDRHLTHEVTSPQAFEGLQLAGRNVRRTQATIAVPDHNVPTTDRDKPIEDAVAAKQIEALQENCRTTGVPIFDIDDIRQGIVHVIGPEQGLTLPGMVIVCGDSHTATHGAFGALAFGIGTSEVEHVLASQCLLQKKARTMQVRVEGVLPERCSAKDIILAIIGKIGTAGGTGHVIEYTGSAIRALSMEGRMTLCNMSIEGGARAGMVAPGPQDVRLPARSAAWRPRAALFDRAVAAWQHLPSDPGAPALIPASSCEPKTSAPQVTWGTNPGMVTDIAGTVPDPKAAMPTPDNAGSHRNAPWPIWTSKPARRSPTFRLIRCSSARVPTRGSKTCAPPPRVSPRARKVAARAFNALVVPGSGLIKQQAEEEGLDQSSSRTGRF